MVDASVGEGVEVGVAGITTVFVGVSGVDVGTGSIVEVFDADVGIGSIAGPVVITSGWRFSAPGVQASRDAARRNPNIPIQTHTGVRNLDDFRDILNIHAITPMYRTGDRLLEFRNSNKCENGMTRRTNRI